SAGPGDGRGRPGGRADWRRDLTPGAGSLDSARPGSGAHSGRHQADNRLAREGVQGDSPAGAWGVPKDYFFSIRGAKLDEEKTIPSKDRRTYAWSSWILRLGMYASFGAMVIGLVWWVAQSAGGTNSAQADTIPLGSIVPELLAGNPLAMLNLG